MEKDGSENRVQEAERTTARTKVGALIKELGTYAWLDWRLSIDDNKYKIKQKMLLHFKSYSRFSCTSNSGLMAIGHLHQEFAVIDEIHKLIYLPTLWIA